MAKTDRATLTTWFQDGDIPSGSQFLGLIDSSMDICASGQPTIQSTASFQSGSQIEISQSGSVIVISSSIADDAITNAKLANMIADTIKGRASGAGTGDPTDLTATQVRTLLNTREKLTAARTYYIRTDGSDSNNGLANTAGGAFLTVQYAIDVISNTLDLGIYDVTIQLAAGTYSTSAGNTCKQCVGAGKVIVLGDETTPANVIITTTGVNPVDFFADGISTIYAVRGVKLTSTGTDTPVGLRASNANITFQNVNFGSLSTSASQHILAENGGILQATGNYSITGNAGYHHVTQTSGAIRIQGRTVTLTGTPAFNIFIVAQIIGSALLNSNTYSGAATGSRYNISLNGVVFTDGAGATYLPGNAAGSTATGGQYA